MALFVNFLQVQLEFGKLVFVKEGGGGGNWMTRRKTYGEMTRTNVTQPLYDVRSKSTLMTALSPLSKNFLYRAIG